MLFLLTDPLVLFHLLRGRYFIVRTLIRSCHLCRSIYLKTMTIKQSDHGLCNMQVYALVGQTSKGIRSEAHNFLSLTNQSVNLHFARTIMFYMLQYTEY
jgi:hypothetical protein